MIVPIFFYAKCDPTFQHKMLDPLEKDIAEIQALPGGIFSVEKVVRFQCAVENYAEQYLIPKNYWDLCREYLYMDHYYVNLRKDNWDEAKAMDHFFQNTFEGHTFAKTHQSYYLMNADHKDNYHNDLVLDFPYKDIDWVFDMCSKNVMTHHPSAELVNKYKEMSKLYSEIKAAEKDTEKWFSLLLGVNIDKFLRSNVEYRLGGNLFDKQLWKLYIGYLKEVDPKAMLVVYSKYIRFFMDDKEILQEYKQQMEEHGPVKLSWTNLFDFEYHPDMFIFSDDDMMNSSGEEDAHSVDEDMKSSVEKASDGMDEDLMNSSGEEESDSGDMGEEMNNSGVEEELDGMDENILSLNEDDLDKQQLQMLDENGEKEIKAEEVFMGDAVAETLFDPQICAAFFNNVNPQNDCSFHQPTIAYLLKHAPPSTLQKLFKCAKYFFARKQTPICFRLEIHNGATAFNDECVKLNYSDGNLLNGGFLSTTVRLHHQKSFEELYWSDMVWSDPVTETFKDCMTSLIPHLYQCDARFIEMDHQNLSFNDLKFLIGGGNCVRLDLRTCHIKDENGDHVELEKIMELLPKIKRLDLPTVKVNSKTGHVLSTQKFDGNISFIGIKNIVGEPFDAEEFKKFIVAKGAPPGVDSITARLFFDKTFDAGFVATLKQTVDEYRRTFPEACEENTYFTIEINKFSYF